MYGDGGSFGLDEPLLRLPSKPNKPPWHEHVNNISVKAAKTLNFIRRYVYNCCAPDIKATAYISLVRPHLEYAAAACDPYLVMVALCNRADHNHYIFIL